MLVRYFRGYGTAHQGPTTGAETGPRRERLEAVGAQLSGNAEIGRAATARAEAGAVEERRSANAVWTRNGAAGVPAREDCLELVDAILDAHGLGAVLDEQIFVELIASIHLEQETAEVTYSPLALA